MDQVGEELAAFVPTDADVENLAVCLFAARGGCSFIEAKRAMQFLLDTERYDYSNLARAAFDHAGYLPSIMAARQDAINTYGHERGIYAAEIAAWQDRCGNLEAQLKVSPRARSDVWVATGPDTALPIDSITRLIEIAHETKDPELRKLATNAAAVLLHPHCPMASA